MSILSVYNNNETRLKTLEKLIETSFPSVNFSQYKSLFSKDISTIIENLKRKKSNLKETLSYNSSIYNKTYLKTNTLIEALQLLKKEKEILESEENLIPGYTYYKNVVRFGNKISGYKTIVRESKVPVWVYFEKDIGLEKALLVLEHGNYDDFQKIYVELSDGTIDPFDVTLNHVMESSGRSFRLIESYCDNVWEGNWPWEESYPYKLESLIEENNAMKQEKLFEMKNTFNNLLRVLNEEEYDKFELVSMINDMVKSVDSMISNLGKISGNAIQAIAQSTAAANDEATMVLQNVKQPVEDAASALSGLKAALTNVIDTLSGEGDSEPSSDDMVDLDVPSDEESDDLAKQLADVSDDHEEGDTEEPVDLDDDGEREKRSPEDFGG